MKILLIDIVRTTLAEAWPSVEHSLGLMYLAAVARERHGATVDVQIWTLVTRADGVSGIAEETRKKLEDYRPDVVGFRCLSIGKDTLTVAARAVKAWRGECVLLAGGPHASDAPEEVLRETPVDCVAIGEGEETFAELIELLLEGRPPRGLAGTAWLEGERIVRGPARPLIKDLDALPLPSYDHVDLDLFEKRYLTFSSKIFERHGNLLTSRGCPYRCLYCHNILGKTLRKRSAESVFEEIRWLHDTEGLTDFQIIDDCFNLDKKRAKKICDLVIRSGMELTFSFPNGLRCDVLDDELMNKLAEMGTRFISVAVETASPRLQKLIKKNLDLPRVFEVIETLSELEVATRGFFMLGFPSETYEEARLTVDFAKASALCGATFFNVVYFPGTDLYRFARSMGYFQDEDEVVQVQRDYVEVAEGPYDFDLETLVALKRSAIEEFAFDMSRIERAHRLLSPYFTEREIDGFFMSYVVSSGLGAHEVQDEEVRTYLHRHFAIAERFSKERVFYV